MCDAKLCESSRKAAVHLTQRLQMGGRSRTAHRSDAVEARQTRRRRHATERTLCWRREGGERTRTRTGRVRVLDTRQRALGATRRRAAHGGGRSRCRSRRRRVCTGMGDARGVRVAMGVLQLLATAARRAHS